MEFVYEIENENSQQCCVYCGKKLGYFFLKTKNNKTRKYYFFSDKPLFINNWKSYRDICIECFQKKTNKLPKSLNVVSLDYIHFFSTITIELIKEKTKIKAGTKENFIKRYGEEEGLKKWEQYRTKQAITNTFDYKNKKYGMTIEEFNEYNKKRSSTKENFIKRYGEEEGLKKWEQYRTKQSYAGSCEQYFVDIYGEEEGKKKWKKICKLKSHNLENYINRYGEKTGSILYEQYQQNKKINHNFFSKIAYDFFKQLEHLLSTYNKKYDMYYGEKEFGMYCETTRKYYRYDFTIPEIKKCIEFNGDIFHASPHIYSILDEIGYIHEGKLAGQIWSHDYFKNENLKNSGYKLLIVWEHEIKNKENINNVLLKCLNFLIEEGE